MPGRSGYLSQGGWLVSGGSSLRGTLTVNSRSGNEPAEYKATELIEFEDGFGSGASDDFTAYIATDGEIPGSGGGTNNDGGGYRYGFNGKEKDNESYGNGNEYDYGFRSYDPRLGRFLSVDPIAKKFPWLTPYQYASNSPIWAKDIDGLEGDKKTDPANQPCHPIQTIEDGYGDYIKRTYSMDISNSKMTAKQIFESLSTNFTKYTTGVSYFERIKGVGGAAVGDEWAITGGPSFRSSRLEDFKKRYPGTTFPETHKDQIDETAGTIYWGEVNTGVTVKSIDIFDIGSIKGYSFTFSTWKGHVEAGEITFSATQFGKDETMPFIHFDITSNSRSSNFISDKAYRFLGGESLQTKHWLTLLDNIKKAVGANVSPPILTTEKSETPIKEKESPVIKPATNP